MDLTFRLIEMRDSMQTTITNVEKVISEQIELVNLIRSSDKSEMFEQFTNSLDKNTSDLMKQKEVLTSKHMMLSKVIDECQDNKMISDAITNLCIVLNVFGNDEIQS